LSLGSAINVSDFMDLGQQPPVRAYPTANPKFNGVSAPIGSVLQQYFNHSQMAASSEKTVFSFDSNAVNPGAGVGGNTLANGICQGAGCGGTGTRVVNVTGDIWRVSPVLGVDYKARPLLGWSGPKVLKDVSGPASNLATADDYTLCYAYKAGECHSGSLQGQSFVKVPNVYVAGGQWGDICHTGMEFAQIPCLMSAAPAAGYVRQFRSDRADVNGADQRLITSLLRPYGTQFPYLQAVAHPSGNLLMAASGGNVEGIRQPYWVIKLPPFPDPPARRNTLGGLKIQIGQRSGMTQARVRFGYNTSFHCTERADACVTDSAVSPFAFAASDTLTGTSCASGCSITVPAIPGRLTYYRVETYNGSTWDTTGDTMIAVP
jgi:hypothetical protein